MISSCIKNRLAPQVIALTAIAIAAFSLPAGAVSVELKDAGPDRVERQRAAAEGRLPLPDTPDISRFAERLSAKGIAPGANLFIRIFKAQSELEIWAEKGGAYILFATYPVCHWSGGLGPKLRQGDKQSPEGFYTLTQRQLHRAGRWPEALNLGYPNAFDRAQSRNGSYILVHGGCSSVGCFAMTNPVMSEIFALTRAAFHAGQKHIPVHVFPFRMTEENLGQHKSSPWLDFWMNLKEGYDGFERTRVPPKISVCQNKYVFSSRTPLESMEPGSIGVCNETAALLQALDRLSEAAAPEDMHRLWAAAAVGTGINGGAAAASLRALAAAEAPALLAQKNFNTPRRRLAAGRGYPACSPAMPACRRFLALQEKRFVKRSWAKAQSRVRDRRT